MQDTSISFTSSTGKRLWDNRYRGWLTSYNFFFGWKKIHIKVNQTIQDIKTKYEREELDIQSPDAKIILHIQFFQINLSHLKFFNIANRQHRGPTVANQTCKQPNKTTTDWIQQQLNRRMNHKAKYQSLITRTVNLIPRLYNIHR